MMQTQAINILFPVYNEEKRLENGIRKTDDYLSGETDIEYVLTIVDNGSTDRTAELSKALCAERPEHVRYMKIAERGVGAAFRVGVSRNQCGIVGYMDVDLATDITHLRQVVDAFTADASVAIVNGSRWSRQSRIKGRKFHRTVTSIGLVCILKLVFRMKASDAICGFKFFRKEAVEGLIDEAVPFTNGWFYIIELLIRAERNGLKIMELPVRWNDDSENSKVHSLSLIREYLHEMILLKHRLR